MKSRLFLPYALTLATLTGAQTPNNQPGNQPNSQPLSISRPDGGSRGPMESIFVPPKPGAPFTLQLAAEWTRTMMNGGGTYTLANQRRIVRDGRGRIYQERWILVPKGGDIKSTMNVFQITDPEQHTWYNCEPSTKICELLTYHLTAEQIYLPAITVAVMAVIASAFLLHQDNPDARNAAKILGALLGVWAVWLALSDSTICTVMVSPSSLRWTTPSFSAMS